MLDMRIVKKSKRDTWNVQKTLPYILLIGAILGLVASMVLTLEHIALLEDPDHQLSCSINPILNCGPIMTSEQATAFGFPNPLIGLVTFGAQALLAVVMLAGARMKAWFWKLYGLSIIGGIAFTLWLMYESIFEIKTLCIYCVTVWVVMFISAWYTFQFMLAEKHLKLKNHRLVSFLRNHHADILVGWFIIIILLILHEFWYYYKQFFGF
jgi:uncharacterized membrane protein